MINIYRLPQHTLLVPSTFATCFGHTDHSEAFKYMTFKTQNKIHTHTYICMYVYIYICVCVCVCVCVMPEDGQ